MVEKCQNDNTILRIHLLSFSRYSPSMPDPTDQTVTQTTSKKEGTRLPRLFLLSFIPFLVFSLGFIPTIVTIKLVLYVITFQRLIDFIILPF